MLIVKQKLYTIVKSRVWWFYEKVTAVMKIVYNWLINGCKGIKFELQRDNPIQTFVLIFNLKLNTKQRSTFMSLYKEWR